MLKEMYENLNKLKDISYSWIRRVNIFKKAIVAKAIYRFITVLMKIQVAFGAEIEKLIIKSIWKCKISRVSKTILEQKYKV